MSRAATYFTVLVSLRYGSILGRDGSDGLAVKLLGNQKYLPRMIPAFFWT